MPLYDINADINPIMMNNLTEKLLNAFGKTNGKVK
jgi:hypothetical protein